MAGPGIAARLQGRPPRRGESGRWFPLSYRAVSGRDRARRPSCHAGTKPEGDQAEKDNGSGPRRGGRQLTRVPYGAFAETSDGLEPLTPSL